MSVQSTETAPVVSAPAKPVVVPAPELREDVRNEIWNLPNSLTLFRIFLVPFLVVVLLTKYSDFLGLGIFLVAAVTDFFDGYFARRMKKITRMGQLLDPIADKLLMSAAFISLVELGLARAWMVDRKSTRLNSSHSSISYAVFCLKKKKNKNKNNNK